MQVARCRTLGIFLPLLLYEYKDQSPAQCTILYNFFSFTNWTFNKFQVRDTQIYQLLTEKDHIEVTKIKSWLQSRGLFLQSSININFLGPKSKFWNCNLLVLKSWSLHVFFMSEKPRGLKVWWLKALALRRYKGNCSNQNTSKEFQDFWKTGPWPSKWIYFSYFQLKQKWRRASRDAPTRNRHTQTLKCESGLKAPYSAT